MVMGKRGWRQICWAGGREELGSAYIMKPPSEARQSGCECECLERQQLRKPLSLSHSAGGQWRCIIDPAGVFCSERIQTWIWQPCTRATQEACIHPTSRYCSHSLSVEWSALLAQCEWRCTLRLSSEYAGVKRRENGIHLKCVCRQFVYFCLSSLLC